MSLCETCAKLDLSPLRTGDTRDLRLGRWDDMVTQATDGCKCCRFFVDYLTYYVTDNGHSDVPSFHKEQEDHMNRRYGDGDDVDIDTDKYKDEVWIDGMRILYKTAQMVANGARSYSCDELCLEICTVDETAEEPGLTETGKYALEKPESKPLDQHTIGDPEVKKLDHKRDIPPSPNDSTSFDLMKSWLQDCESHGCQPQASAPLPPRVIEVGTISEPLCKLIETNGQLGNYMTLSHHCSSPSALQLTTDNLSQFTNGLPFDLLSQTHKDAIHIARSLFIPHLFIPSICTLQDSLSDLSTQLSHIPSIYLNSTLNLSSNSSTSIFKARRIQYSPPLGPDHSLCLRPACLRWLPDVQKLSAAEDPWAIQERILAPRVLHFTERQMMWECAQGWRLEAAEGVDREIGAGQRGYEKANVQGMLGRHREQAGESMDGLAKRYDAWSKIVQELSGSGLSRSEDKLPSAAGIAAALDDGSLGKYFAGTWMGVVEFGLAWSRSFELLTKSAEYRAPSWSWASVDGSVTAIWRGDLQGHLEGPADWWKAHGVKLLETKMLLRNEAIPHTGFMEGSFIRVEGSVVGMDRVLKLADSKTFRILLVLDTSNAFDCACCRPDEDVRDTTGANAGVERVKGYICMIVEGNGWVSDESKVHAVVLHRVEGEEEATFERVGVLQIAFAWPDNEGRFGEEYEGKSVGDEFEEMGWERRVMKLI